ncbi:hypothetical protein KVR01_011119 [Diaporthe batatas]|uniref:uncharacterized protein n=1 Tax=Diaporthe batatas TaxID=748121 RepID=UPI001D036977|nr:uncharacterized protein KVR01_011119 [Diaporthe batatas]KAG8159458.1 hypothetical protein KVR01_011119 [Diaporthe batatas]
MAAANAARPPMPAAANQHKPRASGSWDDLLRNKGQDKMQQARARAAQNNDSHGGNGIMSRRPYSSGVDWRPMSQFNQPPPPPPPQQQQHQPVRARMELHHANQRSSQAFAAHVAALNGNPATSPLSREITLGPELDTGSPDYGIMPSEINHYSLKNNRRSQTYPLPQAQQAPASQRPGMYSRPRPGSFHSFDGTLDSQGRMRANSWGGMPVIEEAQAFGTYPPAHYSTYQQQHAYRSSAPVWQGRPEPAKQQAAARARRPGPDELFNRLPVEVLRLVIGYVRAGHLDDSNSGSNSCATCWMRDSCAVALCNRRLLTVAREALYGDIQLVGKDGAQMGKRYKGLYAPRLVLLRRTLRANRSLGAVVRSLKVPALPDGAPIEATKYHDLVASVVMACPNLERLDGFYPSYRHGSESHLLHALETRRKLKELTWVVEATPPEPSVENGRAGKRTSQSRKRHSRWAPSTPLPADDSTPERRQELAAASVSRFVMRHDNWKELTHLTIHCVPGAGLSTDGTTVPAILALLPGIDSLYLSHLPESSFNDESLLRLPRALKKLGIAHCAGVNTAGLTAFATRSAAARSLETLTLIHQGIDSLDALVRMLAKLGALTTLSVVQAAAPTVGDDTFLFMPYLASRSLSKLHWDIFESGAVAATGADDVLSRSIAAGGFPRLRAVRVPNDPDGLFQALCKPKERADLPGDRYRNAGLVGQATSSKGHSRSSTNLANTEDAGARSSSDTRDSGKELRLLPAREYGSDLHAARLAAQGRLEAARRFPRFEATVVDESGEVVSSEGLAGFIGDAGSRIQYCLVPDEGGTDTRGGLAVMDDLLGDGGEDLLRRGDVSSNAGGGFGSGLAPHCVVPGQQHERVEGAPSRGRLVKRDSGGKSSKEREKERERERERERDGEDVGRAREGCTGRWNSYNPEGLVDKKSASGDRWWHVERGRWRGRVELS